MPISYDQLDREVASDAVPTIPPICSNCGYDLRGSASRQCPECGHITLRKEVAQQTAQAKRAVEDYKEALEWGRRGMMLGATGLALAGWGLLLPSGWLQPILRIASLLAGPTAFFLGLSVFRAKNNPRLILDDEQRSDSLTPSALAVVFGMADCACAILGPW